MPLSSRLHNLANDLEVDKALTKAQLLRHYRLQLEDVPTKTFYTVEHSLSPTKGSGSPQLNTFVCSSSTIARRRGRKLQHLAGVTEMRHLLGAHTADWRNNADDSNGEGEEDGEWRSPQGRTAIEYDIGSYSTKYILNKAHSLRWKGYDSIIWGCPSERLVKSRGKTLSDVGIDVRVLYVPWV